MTWNAGKFKTSLGRLVHTETVSERESLGKVQGMGEGKNGHERKCTQANLQSQNLPTVRISSSESISYVFPFLFGCWSLPTPASDPVQPSLG